MQADNIILFDGNCAFCNGFIRWIISIDQEHFRLCDQQSRQFRIIAHAYGLPLTTGPDAGTIYLVQSGKAYSRTAAVARILRGCRQPYPALGWLLQGVPSAIGNPAYDWIARRRHRLAMARACPLPTPEMQKRVI
jgi:predicted DCC family thiol-disulfide oxidoreductase YuxK